MKTRLSCFAVLFSCLLLVSPVSGAGPDPAREVIRETLADLQGLARAHLSRNDPAVLYDRVREILLPRVDHRRLAALVLGRAWRTASPRQREAFTEAFERLLVRTYANALREAGDWEVRFLPGDFDPGAKRTWVRTQLVHGGGEPLRLDYRLARHGEEWRIYEVQVEGISLVTNYRSSFARILRREGMDGLIRELDRRNGERGDQTSTGSSIARRG